MTTSAYEPFRGGKEEDVNQFLRRIELAAFNCNRDEDAYKLRLVSLLLEGPAREWYEDVLEDDQKANWVQLCIALRARFGRVNSLEDLWKELSRLCQGEEEDIGMYISRFDACWRRITRVLGDHQTPPDFLKKDRFMCLLHESIRGKVEIKDPRTYDEATRMATEQWRKKIRKQELAKKEGERAMYATCDRFVEPLPLDVHVERDNHVEMQRGQEGLHQEIQKLTEQIGNLNLAVQVIQNQVRRPQGERPVRNRMEYLQCYNCGERGHISPQCMQPRREPGGMYPIIQRPQNNASNGNGNGGQGQGQTSHAAVSILEAVPVSDEEDAEIMVGKRTRAQKSDLEDSSKEKKAKERKKEKGKAPMEEAESSKQAKVKARRRRIGMEDFQLGEGQPPYDLLEDMKKKRADITYGQLLQLNSSLRRHWHKLAGIKKRVKVRMHDTHVVQVHKVNDVLPVVDVWIHGRKVSKVYMDGGAQVCVMTEETMHQLGLEPTGESVFNVRMANSSRVKCLGVIHGLELNVMGQRAIIDMHVMPARLGAYPIILGRPWLIAMRSRQDWYRGCIDLFVDRPKEKRIRYDMRMRKVQEIDEESEIEQRSTSTTQDMYDAYSSASSTCSEDDVYDQSLLELDVDVCGLNIADPNSMYDEEKCMMVTPEEDQVLNVPKEELMNMLAGDLSSHERDAYAALFEKYPRLFAKEYHQMRGTSSVKHEIKLKDEAKPIAQKLRRLGTIQRQVLEMEVAKLLKAGFIYPVDDAEWISPVVIVPKKGNKWRVCVDFRPLNAATKRHHYPLPFQDEILDSVAGHERYSVCDGFSGYFQIKIAEEDQKKTSFVTPWGVFCYRVMPFGLLNAYASFQSWMDKVLGPYLGSSVRVFMDDFCVYSDRLKHVHKLEEVFKRIDDDGGQLNPSKCKIAQARVVLLGHEISESGIAPDPSKVECLFMMESPSNTKELMSFVQKLRYLSRSFCMLAEYVHPLQKATQRDPFVWTQKEQDAFESIKEKLSMLPILMPPCWDQVFYLSLSVGTYAIGAVLMQKGEKQSYMRPVYYVSKTKSEIEQSWHEVEQYVWALVYATKRLRSYLIYKPFVVLTSCNLLPHALKYPGDMPRLQKWVLALQQFDMSFMKEESVRANMADMLTYKEISAKKETSKELEKKVVPSSTMHQELEDVDGTLYFDGAFRRSINKGAGGCVFMDTYGKEIWVLSQELDVKSNNEAEYASLCMGLEECRKRYVKRLLIKGDAMLIIRQVQGTWKVNKEEMKSWFLKVRRLLKCFVVYQIWHIDRSLNGRAHQLAEQVFSKDMNALRVQEPKYLGRESLHEEEHVLQTGFARKGLSSQERYAVTKRAMRYVLIGEQLYHKGADGIMRRVLYHDEIFECLKACHEEGCGGHFGIEITRRKVLDAQLMWPSMNKDIVHWCRSCNECQAFQKKRLMPEPLKHIMSYRPFEKWGLDIIGPMPGTKNGKHYILSAVDYMTRWPEARATRGCMARDVCKFIYECICCRFGIPLELVSDQGRQFRSDVVKALVTKLEIKHRYSTPYYPQCNGLVEAFNGVMQKVLFKLVEDYPMDWDMYLDRALWACRVSQKTATGFTPFHLVYGEDCVVPINVMLPSLDFMLKHGMDEEEQLKERMASMHSLLLDRENAIRYYEELSRKRADVFNEKVKSKGLQKGMLVMRYNNALDTTFQTKFKVRWEGPFVIHEVYENGSYQLNDLNGRMHKERVNGLRLKPYVIRIM